jgi:hypothetical protein
VRLSRWERRTKACEQMFPKVLPSLDWITEEEEEEEEEIEKLSKDYYWISPM